MKKLKTIFENDIVKPKIDPFKYYKDYMAVYIKRMHDIESTEISTVLTKAGEKSEIKNPIVSIYQKKDNLDTKPGKIDLLSYLKSINDNDEIVAGTLTTFTKKFPSMHTGFIDKNLKLRKVDKKIALEAEVKGEEGKAKFYTGRQTFRKLNNNSLSGAYSSPGTVFLNRSGHSTLTSTTRIVASTGNALSESMIGGTRIYASEVEAMEHMLVLISDLDMENIRRTVKKYNLAIPTVANVRQVLKHTLELYMKDAVSPDSRIYKFINTLTDMERCAVVYVNDFYHIREFNKKFVKDWLKSSTKQTAVPNINHLALMNNAPEWLTNLVHIICMDVIKGKYIVYDELKGTKLLEHLGSTAYHVGKAFLYLQDLIKTFFLTDIPPINVIDMKETTRRVIVLSDTDSTCATYEDWGDFVYGREAINTRKIAIGGSVTTLLAESLGHYIKVITRTMNIVPDYEGLLQMKSEFVWTSFNLSTLGKHYFADTIYKEGNVFKESKSERKGVHLLNNNIPGRYRNIGHRLQDEIMLKLSHGEELNVEEYILKGAAIEQYVFDRVAKGDRDLFKMSMVKTAESYTHKGAAGPFIKHILWESVFEDKYPTGLKENYYVYNLPVISKSKTDWENHLNRIEDPDFKERHINFMKKYKKDKIGTYAVPVVAVEQYGIPIEIYNSLDLHRLLNTILKGVYITLEAVGIRRHNNMFISDVYAPSILTKGEKNPYEGEWLENLMSKEAK